MARAYLHTGFSQNLVVASYIRHEHRTLFCKPLQPQINVCHYDMICLRAVFAMSSYLPYTVES